MPRAISKLSEPKTKSGGRERSKHSEKDIEDWFWNNPDNLGLDVAMVKRQARLRGDDGTAIDLLAIRCDGRLCTIEIKHGKADERALVQLLKYASLLDCIDIPQLDAIINIDSKEKRCLADIFLQQFHKVLPAVQLGRVSLVLIASGFERSCEHLARFLVGNHGVDLTLLHYRRSRKARQKAFEVERVKLPNMAPLAVSPKPKDRNFVFVIDPSRFLSFDWFSERGYIVIAEGASPDPQWAQLKPGDLFCAFYNRVGYIGAGVVEAGPRKLQVAWCNCDCKPPPEVVPVRWTTLLAREHAMLGQDFPKPLGTIQRIDPEAGVKLQSAIINQRKLFYSSLVDPPPSAA